MNGTKLKGLILIKLSYWLAFAIAAWTGMVGLAIYSGPNLFVDLIKWVAIADVVGTIVIFVFSYFFKNSSFYDPYWSVVPIGIAFILAWFGELFDFSIAANSRAWLVIALVVIWGGRLTWNWFRGWAGVQHEDWRYVELQKSQGKLYWLVSFLGIHMMPTVLVFLACLPLFAVITDNLLLFGLYSSSELGISKGLGWLDALAAIVCVIAIYFETVADNQKLHFLKANPQSDQFLKTGLWSISRHPNYFGEVLFWWGIALFGIASTNYIDWRVILFCCLGALLITLLFLFISIPMMDKRMLARRKGYAAHMKEVPALLPRFW